MLRCGTRHNQSFHLENRLPGADANPYLAFAATIAAGLYGIDNRIEPPDEYVGNAYTAAQLPRVRTSCRKQPIFSIGLPQPDPFLVTRRSTTMFNVPGSKERALIGRLPTGN